MALMLFLTPAHGSRNDIDSRCSMNVKEQLEKMINEKDVGPSIPGEQYLMAGFKLILGFGGSPYYNIFGK